MEFGPRLTGRVAIVTGGGSRGEGVGTGKAASILFARHGARVLVVDRDEGAAAETVKTIREEDGEAEECAADLTSADGCATMVDRAMSRWGRLDILDNNVGIEGVGTLLDTEKSDWELTFQVNVIATMLASKAAIPAMETGGGGSIVNISSISAFRPRGLTPYSAAKGAVIALSRAMAVDHALQGVRVNCIAPGPIFTPMVAAAGMAEDLRERRRKASLLQIEGTAWDVADTALFLVSDEARYLTGVMIPVDGGVSVRSPDR